MFNCKSTGLAWGGAEAVGWASSLLYIYYSPILTYKSPYISIYQCVNISVYQCINIPVNINITIYQCINNQYGKTKGEGLGNTADRLKKLDKSKDEDQVMTKWCISKMHANMIIWLLQVRLWQWRDTVQDIWEDPAIQVLCSRITCCVKHFTSLRVKSFCFTLGVNTHVNQSMLLYDMSYFKW